MHEWLTASRIAALTLPGLPTTESAVIRAAARYGWKSRPRKGRGGGSEYHVSALPDTAKAALLLKSAPPPAPAPLKPEQTAQLKDSQRRTLEARAAILAEIDSLMVMGTSQGKAVQIVVEMAQAGTLRPEVQAMVPVANARAGQGRSLTRATLYNWLKARAAGSSTALAPALPPEHDIPDWAGALMELYGRPQKPSLTDALKALKAQGAAPSYDQARRFLNKLSAITRNSGRMGPRTLKAMRAYTVRAVEGLWPTAIYCADGHTFKAEVAHPIHGRPFRPEITTVIDVYTRKITGWSVNLAENTWSVADAARHAFETHGLCDVWYYDNGPGANNRTWDEAMVGLIARLGITKQNSLPYGSQARGVIERVNRSVWHRAAKVLPTYVGADMDDEARQRAFKITRRDIKAVGTSRLLLPWADFLILCEMAVAQHNSEPHSTLKKITDPDTLKKRHQSPAEAWAEAEATGWQADRLDEAEARDLFRPHVLRKTRRALVSLWGNDYYHPALEAFHGEEVMVAYDIHDAERVWVRDGEGRLICEAIWNGHQTAFMPVSKVMADHEKRIAGRHKRLDAHRDEIEAERGPAALDYRGAPVQVLPMAPALPPLTIEMDAAQTALVAEFTALPSDAPETAEQRYDRWLRLDQAVQGGQELPPAERQFYDLFRRSPVWAEVREHRAMIAEFQASLRATA